MIWIAISWIHVMSQSVIMSCRAFCVLAERYDAFLIRLIKRSILFVAIKIPFLNWNYSDERRCDTRRSEGILKFQINYQCLFDIFIIR